MSDTEWYELLIEGERDEVERRLAESRADGILRGWELHLEEESWSGRLRDLLHLRSHHLVFAPGARALELVRELASAPGLRVEAVRRVIRASFRFTAECYNREEAGEIKGAFLSAPPPGVRVEDFTESEEVDPEARGVELYAPAHDYVYRASGRVTGPLPGVIEMHRRARRLDFVKEGRIEVEGERVELPTA